MADLSIIMKDLQHQNVMKKKKKNLDLDKVAKQIKNAGQAYQGRNGVVHAEKQYLPDVLCGPRCNNNEGCRLGENRKLNIFQQFWVIGTYCEQNNILARYFRKESKATDRVLNSRRTGTYFYFLPDENGIQQPVCKSTFLRSFGISCKRLQNLQTNISSGDLCLSHRRGRHENHQRLGNDVRKNIMDHINSYEKCISHYSTQVGDPERLYLNQDLNLSMMFRDFAASYGEEALSWEWIYRSVFKGMKLKIGLPKSDTCTMCDLLHSRISQLDENDEEQQSRIEETWDTLIEHQINSENGYECLREDSARSKNDPNYHVISVALQGILLCPRLTNSKHYYQQKFKCFNFAIHDASSDKTTMCFWDQREAGRGSSEVSSCIFKYCMEKFVPLQPNENRTLVVYSDRCSGQNNNYMVLTMYRLLIEQNRFTEVNQKFMTTGHSFLPCDRQLSLIEKKQKTATIYTPNDWLHTIEESNLKNPVNIQRMHQNEFSDFMQLSQQIQQPATLKVTESMWFKLTSEFTAVIQSKKLLSDTAWESHILRAHILTEYKLHPLYNAPLNLPQNLIDDLKSMQEFLPQESKAFWDFLP